MPKLIRLHGASADWANDSYLFVGDEAEIPASGDIVLPLARFQAEGGALLDEGRGVGVFLQADQAVEDLAYDLPRLSRVAVHFAKFRDGRGFTSARLLRDRVGFGGEIRAVGEVLREQASFFVRCGFDAFEPSDGSTPEQWLAAAQRFRHVYQRAADHRPPAYVERTG